MYPALGLRSQFLGGIRLRYESSCNLELRSLCLAAPVWVPFARPGAFSWGPSPSAVNAVNHVHPAERDLDLEPAIPSCQLSPAVQVRRRADLPSGRHSGSRDAPARSNSMA